MAFSMHLANMGEELKAQKDRLFLWLPVPLFVGIAAYFFLPREPSTHICAVLSISCAAACFYAWRKHADNVVRFGLYLFCLFSLIASAGILASTFATQVYGTPILEKNIKFAEVEGDVESIEKLDGKRGSRVLLINLAIEEVLPENTPRKIRLTFRKDEGIEAGQRIKTLASLDAPSRAVTPGAYDFRRHLFYEGIGAVGFSYRAATIVSENAQALTFFEILRTQIHSRISAVAGPVSAGIMSALITGERGEIADEDNNVMRDSGLYHLLSISGSHVAMVAGLLFFFARFVLALFPHVALRFPIKKIAALTALVGASFYVMLAGAEVPAVRALMMTGLVMLAVMVDRSPLSMRLFSFSAFCILIFVPQALVGVSFQMSFSAVAAIISFFEYIKPWWMRWYSTGGFIRKSLMYLIAVLLTSVIAGGVTGFFSLYHFQTFAVYGVLSNMMAVPLTAFVIMPAAVVSVLAMPLGLSAIPLKIMEWGVLKLLVIAHWAAGFDDAVLRVEQWPVLSLLLFSIGFLFFLLWSGWYGKAVATVLIVLSFVFGALAKSPSIMVSGSGKLMGVRHGDYLYVTSARKEKFSSEGWARLSGLPKEHIKSFYDKTSPVSCDEYACRYVSSNGNVSFVKKEQAVREECEWADIIISQVPISQKVCKTMSENSIYDLYDFKKNGAYSFYVDDGGFRAESVNERTGDRPWK